MNKNKVDILKKRSSSISVNLVRYFFLLSVSYVVLYPIIFMVCKSLISPEDAIDVTVVWLPRTFSLENFEWATKALDYWKTLGTTLRIQVLSALIETVTCSFVAYGLARFDFKGKNLIFGCVLLTVLVPPQAIIIPLYLNYSDFDVLGILSLLSNITGTNMKLNLLNTGWSFYLPAILGVGLKSGLFVFIYRQFFISFPRELEEAASIDGAGPYYTFFRIAVPSSGIAFICVLIFSLITYWNDYYVSVMFFKENFPLAVALSQISSTAGYGGEIFSADIAQNIKMTSCLIFILPMLVFYLIVQRKFIQSIERVGIVG